MAEVEKKKKQTFCKFPSHGIDLRPLLDLSYEQPVQLYSAPQQQGLNRGLRREQHSRLKRLCEAKKEALPLEEPEVVKTHLRDMIVLLEMEGAYNDKTFTQVEIKPELIGHSLPRRVLHNLQACEAPPPGVRAHASCFIPLK